MFQALLRVVGLWTQEEDLPKIEDDQKIFTNNDKKESDSEQLNEDYQLLINPLLLEKGFIIHECDSSYERDMGLGKIIFGLEDIPVGKKYKTPNGNLLERTKKNEISIGTRTISIQEKDKSDKFQFIEEAKKKRGRKMEK